MNCTNGYDNDNDDDDNYQQHPAPERAKRKWSKILLSFKRKLFYSFKRGFSF